MKNKMAVKSTFRSSNPSESFQWKTFHFSLGKVCKALEKFNKAPRSHQHATDAPPTHHRRISYLVSLKSGQRVGRQSVDSWPSVGRLSADCRPTVGQLSTDALADVSTDASVGSDSLPSPKIDCWQSICQEKRKNRLQADYVTKDNRENPEYHVIVAIRKLRTDKNCPAENSWQNHVKNEQHIGSEKTYSFFSLSIFGWSDLLQILRKPSAFSFAVLCIIVWANSIIVWKASSFHLSFSDMASVRGR